MHRAFQHADQSPDRRVKARLIANHCDTLLHWIGIDAIVAELPRLRQVALATGDPYCSIAFYSLVAELQARKGSIQSAKLSIETAANLLSKWPNIWQLGRLHNASAGVYVLEGDYSAASIAVTKALAYASRSGSLRLRIPALNNFAHIKLTQGFFAEASSALVELLSIVPRGGNTEIAALDTQLQVALAEGALTLAKDLARRATEISSRLEDGRSYHGLWLALTRTKLFYATGNPQEGLNLAEETIPKVARFADENLLTRLNLAAAEGCALLNRSDDAANLLSAALRGQNRHLDVLTEANRVSALLTSCENTDVATHHFRLAAAISREVGNEAAMREIARDAERTIGLHDRDRITEINGELGSNLRNSSGDPSTARILEKIGTLLDVVDIPPVLARVCAALLLDIGAASRVGVFCENNDNDPQLGRMTLAKGAVGAAPVRIDVGSYRGSQYYIVAHPAPTAICRLALLAIERLIQSSMRAQLARSLEKQQLALWPSAAPEHQLGLIYGSARMAELVKTVERVAESNLPVLLLGETGVGKELFARALHMSSVRKSGAFVAFNVTAAGRDILDSQLFGHKRGSFTGALADSPGLIKSAAGGTFFLDEIGEMSVEAQPKLLRFLESGEILPLGQSKSENVDVRIIAATNANLEQLIADGRFREDLYYRLNVVRIEIPPLRERREEIPLLVNHFLERCSREQQKPMPRIADETLEYLVLYRWPGNVRQLANEIRRMVALAEPGAVLMPAHLSADIAASRRTVPTEHLTASEVEIMTRIDQPLAASIEHVERASIQRAMAICDGRVDDAAKLLGLSRKGLYLKRQRLKIEDVDLRRS